MVFHDKNEEKEKLLTQYDNLNNIPLTIYLKKKSENDKNLSLIEYLTPSILK